MIPINELGGCQGGRLSDAYQPGEEDTHIPEPKAKTKTKRIPITVVINLKSIALRPLFNWILIPTPIKERRRSTQSDE